MARRLRGSSPGVRRDLEDSGVTGVTPEKVRGQDGKGYPARKGRAERVGQTEPRRPKLLERDPGDDTESEAAARARRPGAGRGPPGRGWPWHESYHEKNVAAAVSNHPQPIDRLTPARYRETE
jgi:hypothetical protein